MHSNNLEFIHKESARVITSGIGYTSVEYKYFIEFRSIHIICKNCLNMVVAIKSKQRIEDPGAPEWGEKKQKNKKTLTGNSCLQRSRKGKPFKASSLGNTESKEQN